MKKRLLALVAALALCVGLAVPAFAAQTPSVVWLEEGLQGTSLLGFSEGMLAVGKGLINCGFVDVTGKVVIPLEYEDVSYFSDGMAAVGKPDPSEYNHRKWGFVDKTGKLVIPCKYDVVGNFSEGLAPVRGNDVKWGVIDKSGKLVIPMEYDFIRSFHDGWAEVEKDGKRGFIDKSGKVVIPIEYQEIGSVFKDGLASVRKNGKWGVINKTGEFVIQPKLDYFDVWGFSPDWEMAVVRRGNGGVFKCGFINKSGSEVIPLIYDGTYGVSEGLAAVQKGSSWGFIDKTGQVIIPFEYSGAGNFENGLAPVCVGEYPDGKWGYIDKTGEMVIPADYDSAYSFVDGAALVKKGERYGILTLPAAPTVGGFSDVREDHYFAEAVLWAAEQKITGGTSATTFSPDQTCTRAQILTFLWRANGSPEPAASASPFTDIKPADYYYKAALWAAENGLVSGSAFGGSTPCTRAATVNYFWKAAGSPAASANVSFADVPAGADYAQAVAWAVEQKITGGTSRTTFSPDEICTRGQIVTLLHRALGK